MKIYRAQPCFPSSGRSYLNVLAFAPGDGYAYVTADLNEFPETLKYCRKPPGLLSSLPMFCAGCIREEDLFKVLPDAEEITVEQVEPNTPYLYTEVVIIMAAVLGVDVREQFRCNGCNKILQPGDITFPSEAEIPPICRDCLETRRCVVCGMYVCEDYQRTPAGCPLCLPERPCRICGAGQKPDTTSTPEEMNAYFDNVCWMCLRDMKKAEKKAKKEEEKKQKNIQKRLDFGN